MDFKPIYYPESQFGGFTDVDGTIAFFTRVNALLTPSSVILDVGCGSGGFVHDPVWIRRELQRLKGKCRKVIGIDVDDSARKNPGLDEFRIIDDTDWPVEDESVDLCVCQDVLEHIQEPEVFFSECHRVLRRNGYLCLKTPNVLSYVGLCSRLVPNRLHHAVLRRVQRSRKEADIFPTRYRCNTPRGIIRMLKRYDFEYYVYGYEAEPSYLSFSRFLYLLGVVHQRFAPSMFRTAIHAFGRKKTS
jgi:SAM-dependent methyltransferase